MNFLHIYHPTPILFQLGPLQVHWYGFFIVLGILLGLFFVLRLAKHYGFTADDVYDLAFYLIIFSVLGARLYMILLYPSFYLNNPLEIFKVWKGGLAIHGVIFAGVITLYIYCKKKKQKFWIWADMLVPALALGQAIGRWGNYFNQEVFGAPTSLPWGIPIDLVNRMAGFTQYEYFHPTFLYESILNFILFLILLSLHHIRIKKQEVRIKESLPLSPSPLAGEGRLSAEALAEEEGEGVGLPAGNIALIYLMGYSLIRIAMEQFRIDETLMVFGIRFPVLVSAGVILVAISILPRRIN